LGTQQPHELRLQELSVELAGLLTMSQDELTRAVDLLERHYGRLGLEEYRSGWPGCLRYILERQLSKSKFIKAWPELEDSWLNNVQELAQARREELWDFLQQFGVSASLMAFLHKLAKWWINQVAQGRDPLETEFVRVDSEEFDIATSRTEWQREVMRQDRTLAARLACVVFASRQFPATRAVWRVACRHQWVSWQDDPLETAGLFEQFLARSQVDFAQFAEWMIQVGEEFCGAKPKCLTCPLQSVLSPSGPCEPDDMHDH